LATPPFSQSVMVSVGISKLGCTELFFVELGTKNKWCNTVKLFFDRNCCQALQYGVCPVMTWSSSRTAHQAPSPTRLPVPPDSHRARETLDLLRQETPGFIPPDLWPPNSPDLNPVDYEIWAVMQRRVYETKIDSVNELKRRVIDVWCGLEQLTIDMAIDNGVEGFERASVRKEDTSNTAYELTTLIFVSLCQY